MVYSWVFRQISSPDFPRSPQDFPDFSRFQVTIRTGRDDARAVRRKTGAAHVGFRMAVQQPSHLEPRGAPGGFHGDLMVD